MMGKLTRKLVSAGLSLFLVLGSVSLSAPAIASPSDLSAADVYSAKFLASQSKQRVKVESLLTEDSTTFVNPDGSFTTDSSSSPIRVRDENAPSGWRDLDFTLVLKPDGTVGPLSGLQPISLSNGGSADEVAVSGVVKATDSEGVTIGFGWSGALPVPTLEGNRATYPNVLEGVDLVVEANAEGFEQFFVLSAKPSLEILQALAIPLQLRKVKLQSLPDGSFSFKDGSNEIVATIPSPRVWDSSIEPMSGLPDDQTFDLSYLADAKTLSFDNLASYFQNPNLVYPVTIDPAVSLTTNGDTYVLSDTGSGYGTSSELLVGTYNGGATKARSFVRFNSLSWMKKQILSASLKMYETWSYSCSARNVAIYPATGNMSSSTNWSNQPGISTSESNTVSTAKGYSSSCAAGWVTFNATSVVDYLSKNYLNSMHSTIAVRANESDNYGWKRFSSGSGVNPPVLSVTYNTLPQTPSSLQVTPGQIVSGVQYATNLTPTFSALVSDGDSDKQTVTFSTFADSTSTTPLATLCSVSNVITNTTASCKSTLALADNSTYYIRATASDTKGTTLSNAFLVKTAGTPPNSPAISCQGFANGSNSSSSQLVPIQCALTQTSTNGVTNATKINLTLDSGETQTIDVVSGNLTYAFTLPAGNKAHVVQATAFSEAGLASTESSYSFSIGTAGVYWPTQVVKSSGTTKISAYVSPTQASFAAMRIDWITEDSNVKGSKTLNFGSLQSFKTLQGLFDYQWNTRDLFADSSFRAYAAGGVGQVYARVCFVYILSAEKCTPYDISVLAVQHAYGPTNPVSQAGYGKVSLITGELQHSATDVSQTLAEGSLSITRTHLSYDGQIPASQAVFGNGWKASFTGIDSGVVNYSVSDATLKQGLLSLVDPEGTTLVFATPNKQKVEQPLGTYLPVEQETRDSFATLKVDQVNSVKRLQFTEAEGRVTTWNYVNSVWQLQSIVEPNGLLTNSYSYDSAGKVTRILGPVPAGVSCPLNSEQAGCKALYVTYAASTTATTSATGSYQNQVKSISYKAWDPSSSTMKTTVLATYDYFANGYLAQATDSRTQQSTSYTYSNNSLLQNQLIDSVTIEGFAAYRYKYSSTAELLNVTRDKADGSAGYDIENTFAYNVPLSGGNLPDLATTNTSIWGQLKSPKFASVAFGADQTFSNSNLNTQLDLSTLTANQIKTGDFYYTDSEGNLTNTAQFGIDSWRYTYTNYDSFGRPVASFDESAISQLIDLNADGFLSGVDVNRYATVNKYKDFVYSADGTQIDGGQLIESWSPLRQMSVNGEVNAYRLHTMITYDENAPATKLAGGIAYGLETSRTVSLATNDGLNETLLAKSAKIYDPIDGSSNIGYTSGWILRKPTKTQTIDVTSGNVISQSQTLYDTFGRVTKTIANGSDGTDSLTDYYTYYTVGTNPNISSCSNKPAWAGLICFVGTANGSTREKPNKQITSYDYNLKPLVTVETTTTASRTTTVTYYADNISGAAGKPNTTTVTTTGVTGQTIDPVQNIYDATTGLLLKTQSTTNPANQYVSYTYDLWGRKTSTTSKQSSTVTDVGSVTYQAYGQIGAGQVASVNTGQNTLIYTYGSTNSTGQTETRSLPTGLAVSGIGNYTAEYNNAGQLTLQEAPGTVNQTIEYDQNGQLTRMAYSSDITTNGLTSTVEWFENTRVYDWASRVKSETTPTNNPQLQGENTTTYTYDQIGRLTAAFDNSDLACASRTYSFDIQGNRVGKTSATTQAAGSECDATLWVNTSRNLTFNKFSQITSAGYVYDGLGRNTMLPAVDSPNGTLTSFEFAADNRITKQVQGTNTWEYTFDVLGRRITETAKTGSTVTSATTRHYSNDSDNPTWVSSAAQTDIYTPSLGSALNVVKTVVGATITKAIQIANLHGDTITNVSLPASGAVTPPTWLNTFDEYGLPTNTATNTPPSDLQQLTYGSLGQAQRQTSDTGITLMGVRGYNPVTGQFLSPDPIPGGNETPYNYPNDPVNLYDISGTSSNSWVAMFVTGAISASLLAMVCFASAGIGCLVTGVVLAGISAATVAGVEADEMNLVGKQRDEYVVSSAAIGMVTQGVKVPWGKLVDGAFSKLKLLRKLSQLAPTLTGLVKNTFKKAPVSYLKRKLLELRDSRIR